MFQPVKLMWKGKEVLIPSSKVLGAIAVSEQHLSLFDIAELRMRPKPASVAAAYAAVLRYAGEDVTDEEVYNVICDPAEDTSNVMIDISALVMMMLPSSVVRGNSAPDAATKPVKRTGRRKS